MSNNFAFEHPALCPLEALCSKWDETTKSWTCHSYSGTQPANCDPSKDVMLWGRQTRQTNTLTKTVRACIKDSMCEEGEKCYARRCDTAFEEESDDERLYAYVNGACGTISPHAEAKIEETNVTGVLEISCSIDTEYEKNGIERLFPNRPGQMVLGGFDYFENTKTDRYGQIILLQYDGPDTWYDGIELDSDSLTLPVRVFDTRAKAQACMLCSLWTARNFGYHAFIRTNEFAKCFIYPQDHAGQLDDYENCTVLFGDNIFVAREGYREVETLDPHDPSPAYLLSGIVPENIQQNWLPFSLMPPLYSADGNPYTIWDPQNNSHLMPQFAGIYESMNPFRETRYTRASTLDEWTPGDYTDKNPNFAIMWDFVNFATSTADTDYSLKTPDPAGIWTGRFAYRPMNPHLFYRPELVKPLSPGTDGPTILHDLVPRNLCDLQYSYCCAKGPELEGIDLSNEVKNIFRCGKFNKHSYGLNHPYRAMKCTVYNSNAESEIDQKPIFSEHYRPVIQPSPRDSESLNYAADVLIVPRTYDLQKEIYGWAKKEDLFDVERRDTCKYDPGKKDYCLRKDRGRATSKVNVLGTRCSQRDPRLLLTSTPDEICGDEDMACREYVGKGSASTSPTSTTEMTTTTTAFAIQNLDVVRYFTVYGVGGAHFRYRYQNGQINDGTTTAMPAKIPEYGPNAGGFYPWQSYDFPPAIRPNDYWRAKVKETDEINTNIEKFYYWSEKLEMSIGYEAPLQYYAFMDTNESIMINTERIGEVITLAVGDTAAQQVPIFLAFVNQDRIEGEAAVIYPAGAEKGVCGVYYRYSAVDAPDTLFSVTMVDKSTAAHTRCRDFCTAWKGCLAYSFDGTRCKLYSKYTVVKNSQNPNQLPFEWYRKGNNYNYLPYSVFWEGNEFAQYATEMDEALLEYLGENVKRETKYDNNALLRDAIPATENPDLLAGGAFDIYAGYSFCPTANQYRTNTRKGRTLQQCLFEAGAFNHSAFVWYGRLDSCVLYTEPFQSPVRVANAYPNPPRGPLAKCSNASDVPQNTIEIGIQELDERASLPVLGLASENTDLKCVEASLQTTTSRTVASRTSVAEQKAVYASIFAWCHTDEPRWIYPVYTDDHDGIFYKVDEIENFGDTVYIDLREAKHCTESPPSGYELYGLSNATATTTPTTTATTTTQTFVNRFTEADTAVTIGVVAGVIGTGIILILLRVAGC